MRAIAIATLAMLACSPEPRPADAPVNTPATDLDRMNALGDLTGLSAELARAFDPVGYDPMRIPHANDWLDTHSEPGQTFAQHVAGAFPTPGETRRTLYLLPLGPKASTGSASPTRPRGPSDARRGSAPASADYFGSVMFGMRPSAR